MNKIRKYTVNFRVVFFLILSFSILSGCSSAGIKDLVEAPKIQVHKVEMGNFSLRGGSATFVLDIQNPNKFPIPLTGFDYGLRLNGVEVARADKAQKTTIRAGESQKVRVPVNLSFSNMISMIPGLLRDRQVKYDLGGSVHLPWFNIPFNRSGVTAIR
jgi:LEA14-like dessication related protein